MKIIDLSKFGGPEVLVPASRPDPVAGAGEVLIRVRASGINRPDVLQRSGAYPPPPGAPEWPGLEVAGTIESGDAQAMGGARDRAGVHHRDQQPQQFGIQIQPIEMAHAYDDKTCVD